VPSVPSSCPICEQPLPPTAQHCAVCGFPTALAIEALRAAKSPGSIDPGPVLPEETRIPPEKVKPPPPPEVELNATLGRRLRERMEALRPLGRDTPDVTNEMCEAALSEAAGRVSEALEILRSAQSRLERQTREAVRRRAEAATERRAALERTGIHLELEVPSVPEDDAFDPVPALVGLVALERELVKYESDWKGIQGLLSQVESLRTEATDLGIPLGEVPQEIDGIRRRLSGGPLRGPDLETIGQDVARVLMLLHDTIPASLGEELTRHAAKLEKLPEEAPQRDQALRFHEEATRHIEKGRLSAALQSVRDLRRAILEIEEGPRPPPVARPTPAPIPPDEAVLHALLKKARSLAARVRTLPTDSPLALEAAAQIREATDFLRLGRAQKADQVLSELMRLLAQEEARR